MLAIATTDQLSCVDPHALKRPPSSLPSCLSLLAPCTASAWAPDNLSLFLLSANTIHQYNPALNALTDVYSSTVPIAHLVCRTESCVVFATADKIHVLESANITQTFTTHKTPITSLALSNDLLASTSAGAAQVHNLSSGLHTVLRGLNVAGQHITTCVFHPHTPARLLLGIGKQLVVYDTARSSGPLKSIPMNESTGEILSITCSPFSKTLVAVASAEHVGLVDLDKEKGLFRTLNLKVAVTSVTFSPEGASIYLGTATGKLLIVDLRALDKPPKSVVISESGSSVNTMAVQKKARGNVDTGPKTTAAVRSETNPTKPPSSAATATVSLKTAPKGVRTPSKGRITQTVVSPKPALPAIGSKALSSSNLKVLSPSSVTRRSSTSIEHVSAQSSKAKAAVASMAEVNKTRLGAKRLPSKGVESLSSSPLRKPALVESASPQSNAGRRVSSTTRTVSSSTSARSAALRPHPSASRPGSSASQRSSPPPVAVIGEISVLHNSRTPSPELPSITGPTTPLAVGKKGFVLETPERGDILSKGKGKGKTVNFDELPRDDDEKENERERSLSMQISPRRPAAGLGNSASWAPSPLRNSIPSSPAGSSAAHDLLRTIVRDVMLDFQQEQHSEMVGLHLDLLRMGRDWKKELRDLMDEYMSDLTSLRAENKRLLEENQLLRRGY